MTEPIAVEFDGDCWCNPDQFRQKLNQHPQGESLLLDLCSEGPSLATFGITNIINEWLTSRQQSPDTVHVTRWSNPVEFVPYRRIECSNLSHFFFMCQHYWQYPDPTLEQQLQYQQLFGIFIGRLTMSRAAILFKLLPAGTGSIGEQIFASLMQPVQPFPWRLSDVHKCNFENISDWFPLNKQVAMFDWLLDGYYPWRRNSCFIHELRRCEANVQEQRQVW